MGAGESGVPFYNLQGQYEIAKSSWADPGLGNSVGIGVAGSPTFWLFSRIQNFGVPAAVVQAIFFLIIFCVAGFSVYLLTKEIFLQLNERFVFLAVLFYWFNPLSMVNIWNRFLYNYMAFWALLPLAMFLFLRGLRTKNYLFSICTSFSTLVFSFALSSLVFNILLWFLFTYMLLFFLFTEKDSRFFYLKYFILTFVTYVLFNFWWIGQLFSFVFSSGYEAASSVFFGSAGNLGTLISISQRLGKLINILSLSHATFFSEAAVWSRVYIFPLVIFLEFLITGIVFWAIYKYRKIQGVLFLGLLFLITAFLTKGSEAPLGEIFQAAFLRFTPLQIFRNPFEKFGFLLPLALAPIFSFSLSNIRSRFLYPLAVFIICIIWGFPFWTGLVFTRKIEDTSKFISYEVKVPLYYKEANDWFKKQAPDFRFISLPLDGEGMTYTWEKPYSGVELSSILFDIPNISFNTSVPFYSQIVDNLERLILTKDNISGVASLLNVKYLLLRKDIDWKERGIRDPETISRFLNSDLKLKNVGDFGSLSIYALPSDSFIPKAWTPSSLIRVYPKASFEDFVKAGGIPGQAFYSFPDGQELPNTNKIFIEPSAMIFLPKEKVYGPQDALAGLLYVKYLPDDRFYKFTLLKESLERARLSDPTDLFIFDLTHLGKRAVELYRLGEKQVNEKYIEDAASFYLNTFDELIKNYPDKFENSPRNSFWRITSEEFHKHLVLLNDAQKKSSGKNSEILKNALQGLGERMINMGFASTYAQSDSLKVDSWVFRFDVPENGIYDVRLENSQWKQFYGSLPSEFHLQIDDNVVALAPTEEKDFISFGGIRFEKGIHEIRLENPERKNLLEELRGDIELSSATKPEVSFDVSAFDSFASYEVSFDYWIKRGNSLNFLVYDNNDPKKGEVILPGFAKKILTDGYNNDFLNERIFMSPRSGADSIKIAFRADPFLICPEPKLFLGESCKDKDYIKNYSKETQVVIRNISVKKVFNNKMVLLEDRGTKETINPSISFSKVNQAEYRVHVEGALSPYVLVFSELYSSGWEARFDDGTKLDASNHFLVNAYANGWLVDKLGSYDLTLKFAPEDLLDGGKKVSLFSSAGALLLLGVYIWRRRKLSN